LAAAWSSSWRMETSGMAASWIEGLNREF